MKQNVFAVYDSKAEIFMQPMFFINKGEALRAFNDECNREKSQIFNHPEDYTLFFIGEYELETGLLTPIPTPTSMGLAIEYKKESNQIPLSLDPERHPAI